MEIDISPVIVSLLSNNLGPSLENPEIKIQPNYGISASCENGLIELELIFRRDAAYCCMEWGCHLGFISGDSWEKFRLVLSAEIPILPDKLTAHLKCIIEEGARFFDLSRPDPQRKDRFAFYSAGPFRYEVSAIEGNSPIERDL